MVCKQVLEAYSYSCLHGPSGVREGSGYISKPNYPGSNCKSVDLFSEEPAGDLSRVWLAQGIVTLQEAAPVSDESGPQRWLHSLETWVLYMGFHIQAAFAEP